MITEHAPGGWWRVEAGTIHVVLQHEKVRNSGGTADLTRPVTFAFHKMSVFECVSFSDTQLYTHISSNLTNLYLRSYLASYLVLYFCLPVSLSFSFCLCGIASLHRVSRPAPSPPRSSEAGLSAPLPLLLLRGSWCIFGLVSLDTSPTVRSIPSTLSAVFPTHLPYVTVYFFYTLPVSSSATSPM